MKNEYENDCYKNASWSGTCIQCNKEYDLKDMYFFTKFGTMICYNDLKKDNPAWDYLPYVKPIGDGKK